MTSRRIRWQGALAIGLVWIGRLAMPVGAPALLSGCACGERGSAVVFDEATVEREPAVYVEGEACNTASVVCMHRDAKDRCDTFWIDPIREGRCVFSARFADGSRLEEAIEYDRDDEYPCRGNVRPRHDGLTRIRSKS
ncbi:MAG: hypothetical protein K0S65_354 [Labilithrix sp.]|nr:hypothetical protein [Labilithrix sp.]